MGMADFPTFRGLNDCASRRLGVLAPFGAKTSRLRLPSRLDYDDSMFSTLTSHQQPSLSGRMRRGGRRESVHRPCDAGPRSVHIALRLAWKCPSTPTSVLPNPLLNAPAFRVDVQTTHRRAIVSPPRRRRFFADAPWIIGLPASHGSGAVCRNGTCLRAGSFTEYRKRLTGSVCG